MGPGNKNLGKLVEVMVLVLAGGNDLSNHDTRQRMALLLKQMQVSVPPQVRPLKLLSAVPMTTLWSQPPCGALCCRDKPPLTGRQVLCCLQIFQDIVGKLKPRERKQLDSALSA